MLLRLPAAAATAVSLLLAPAASARDVRIDEGDDGRTVSVAADATVRVVLEQNGSTGAGWRFARRPARSVLRFERAIFVPPPEPEPGEPQIAGAPGTKTYTFRTRARGTTAFSLALRGPDGEVLDRLRVSIRVT